MQQGESTRTQQQQGDITVQQKHAAEAHAAAARPGTGEQIAHFTQQIKAAASSAVQTMHNISVLASIWWKKHRRSSAENENRSAEAAGIEGYQHVEEAASAAAAAARTEQPGASSTTGTAAAEKEDACTHNSYNTHSSYSHQAQNTTGCYATPRTVTQPTRQGILELRGAHMETKGIGPLRSTTMGY